MKRTKQNSNLFNNNKQKIKISSHKHLNTIEECPESEDIIKKLEAMEFSTDKSFETPFISLSKTRDKIINKISNLNKSISVPNLYIENFEEIPSDIKSLKEEEINDSNYLEVLSKFLNNKEKKEEKKLNNINKLSIKEKCNRIYMNLQKCNLNINCLDKMTKFINSIDNSSNNIYQQIELILDVVSELSTKIQEEYTIKKDLITKLNNFELNKENYEKQINAIKIELLNKEEQLTQLMNKDTIDNIENNNKKDNSQQGLMFLINNAKKENQFLFEKILNYKMQIKKILSSSKILFEKHKICLEEIDKLKSKSNKNLSIETVNNIVMIPKKGNYCLKENDSNSKINKRNSNNTNSNNEIYTLANKLISLLLKINRTLFKLDFNLIKINSNSKVPLNDISEINPTIDINFLMQEKNFQLFSKYISCNIDIINNKIINISKNLYANNNKINKENKNSSMTLKNSSEIIKNSNISRFNQSIKFFSPENKNASKTMKNYINLKKTRNNMRNQKLTRNSTSRDGLSYLNFYNNNDSENITVIKKNNSNKKSNQVINQTMNLEKQKNIKQNSSKFY
jgi:hypothetical protein